MKLALVLLSAPHSVCLLLSPRDAGFPCQAQARREILRHQGPAEEGHSEQEGGDVFEYQSSTGECLKSRRVDFLPNRSVNSAKTHHGGTQRAAEECQTPLSGRPSLLLPDCGQVVLCVGFHQRRRGECPRITKMSRIIKIRQRRMEVNQDQNLPTPFFPLDE